MQDEVGRPVAAGPSSPDGARPLVGARFARTEPAPTPPESSGHDARPRFDSALRGYERRQVDAHLQALDGELERLREEVRELNRRLRAGREYASGLEAQLRRLREAGGEPVEAGAGPIADRVMRMARIEAAKIRAVAIRDANALVAQARMRAEGYERGPAPDVPEQARFPTDEQATDVHRIELP